MTIAIGAVYSGGVIVCADTKVVASDGATTKDSKLFLSGGEDCGMFVIADAAEDGRAAKMLAGEIRDAIFSADPNNITPAIKTVMTEWSNAYKSTAPFLQFIIGRVFPPGVRSGYKEPCALYICEPPATVLETWEPVAIGRGSRAVEPLLPILTGITQFDLDLQMVLLRMAFLMNRAKKEEGSACGGETHAMVLTVGGGFDLVSEKDMRDAEGLAQTIETFLLSTGRMMTTGAPEDVQEKFIQKTLLPQYRDLSEKARGFPFESLKFLREHMNRNRQQ